MPVYLTWAAAACFFDRSPAMDTTRAPRLAAASEAVRLGSPKASYTTSTPSPPLASCLALERKSESLLITEQAAGKIRHPPHLTAQQGC